MNCKPKRESAPLLHKLYKDNAPFKIPNAYELILDKLRWDKWFAKEYDDLCGDIDDCAEIQELCDLIGVDWQDIDISSIDEYLANKSKHVN